MSDKVSFRLTHADLKHLDMHGRIGISVLTWLATVLIVGGFTTRIWLDARGFFDRLTGLPQQAQLPLLYSIVFTTLFIAARYRLRLAQKPVIEDKHTVAVSPDAFTFANSRGAHHFPWRGIRTATADSHGIYVTTDSGDRLIIPSHAFASRDALDKMFSTIRRLVHENRDANE